MDTVLSQGILPPPIILFPAMGQEPVVKICSTWDIRRHNGEIVLYGRNGKLLDRRSYTDVDEFQLALDLLQNEVQPSLDEATRQMRLTETNGSSTSKERVCHLSSVQ